MWYDLEPGKKFGLGGGTYLPLRPPGYSHVCFPSVYTTTNISSQLFTGQIRTKKHSNKQKQCRPRGRLAAQQTRERPPGLEAWSGFARQCPPTPLLAFLLHPPAKLNSLKKVHMKDSLVLMTIVCEGCNRFV